MAGRSRRDSLPYVNSGGDGRSRTKKITHTSRSRKIRPKTPAPTSSFHSSHLPQWIKHKKVAGKKKNVSKSATWTIEMEEYIQGPKTRNTNTTSGRGYGDSGNHSRNQRKRRAGVRGKRGVASAAYSFRVAYAVGVSDEKGTVARAVAAGSTDTTAAEPLQQQFFELMEQWAGGGGGGGGGGNGGTAIGGSGGSGGAGGTTGGRGKGAERRAAARPPADGSAANEAAGYSVATVVRPMSPESQFIISTAVYSSGSAVAAAAATSAAGIQQTKGAMQNTGIGQTSGSGAGDSGQFVSFVSTYCPSPDAASGAPNSPAPQLPVLVPPLTNPSTPRPNSPERSSSNPVTPQTPTSSSSLSHPIPLPPPPPHSQPSEPVNHRQSGSEIHPSSPKSNGTRSQSPKPPSSGVPVEKTHSPTSIRGCQPRQRSSPSPTSPGKRIAAVPVTTTQQQHASPTRRHSASPSIHTDRRQITTEHQHSSSQNSANRLQNAQDYYSFASTTSSMSFLSRIGRGNDVQPTPRLLTTLPSALPPSFTSMAHLTRRKSPTRNAPSDDVLKKSDVITPQLPLDAKSLLERPVLLSNMLVRSEDCLKPVPFLEINTNEKNTDSFIMDQTYRLDYTTLGKRMKERKEETFFTSKYKYPYQSEASQTDKTTHLSLWADTTSSRFNKTKESLRSSVNAISTPALTQYSWCSSKRKDQMLPKKDTILYPLFQRSISSTSLSVNLSSIASQKNLSSISLLEPYSSRSKNVVHGYPTRKSSFVQATNKKKSRESNKVKKHLCVTKQNQPSTQECENILDRKTMVKESTTSTSEKKEIPKQALNLLPVNPPAENSDEASEVKEFPQPAGESKSQEIATSVEDEQIFLEIQNKVSTKRRDSKKQLSQFGKYGDGPSEAPKQSIDEKVVCPESPENIESEGSVSQSLRPQCASESQSISITVAPTAKEEQGLTSTTQITLPPVPSECTAKASPSVTSTKSCVLIALERGESASGVKESDVEYNIYCTLSKDSFSSDTEKKLGSENDKTYLISESKVCQLGNAEEFTSKCSETPPTEDLTEMNTSTETLKKFSSKEEKFTDENLENVPSNDTEKENSTFTPNKIDEGTCINNSIKFPELQQIHESLQNMTQFLSRRVEEVVSAVSLSAHGTRFANHSISLLQRTVSENVKSDKPRCLSANAALFSPRLLPQSSQQDCLSRKQSASFPQRVQQDSQYIPAADLEMSSLMVANMIGLLSDTISELTGIPIKMASEMIKAGSKMRRRLEAVKARSDPCPDTVEEKEKSSLSGEHLEEVEGIRNPKSGQRSLKSDREHRKLSESMDRHGKLDSLKSKNTERHRRHTGSPSKRALYRREKMAKASKKTDGAENKGVMTDEIKVIDEGVTCKESKTLVQEETCHEITDNVHGHFSEQKRKNISSEFSAEVNWGEEVCEQDLRKLSTHIVKNDYLNSTCSNENWEGNSNKFWDGDNTKETKSQESMISPKHIVNNSCKKDLFTRLPFQESAIEKESETSECNIEHSQGEENRQKVKREYLKLQDIPDPMFDLNQTKDDGEGNTLTVNSNNCNKLDKTWLRAKGDEWKDSWVNQTGGNKNYILKQRSEPNHMNHEGNNTDEQVTNDTSIIKCKDCSQKSLLLASQTEAIHGNQKATIHSSICNRYHTENTKEEHVIDEGTVKSIKWKQCTDSISTNNNNSRKEIYGRASNSLDRSPIQNNATNDLKHKDNLRDLYATDAKLRTTEVEFRFSPSLDRTHCTEHIASSERKVHFDASALGYRVPRKRTRVERTTRPISDNLVYFSISEKMKIPSSDATSETSSSCSARTVKEAVPKTNLDQSTNAITKQGNMSKISFTNRNCKDSKVIKNNVTPDILLAPNKKVYDTPLLSLSPHTNPRPKSILTIPVEDVERFREGSIIIGDHKHTDTCHEQFMKQYPTLNKKKRKRLEFQKIPIRTRKRTKIPDSWNPLKLNIPSSLKFNVFQTCEIVKSMSEEKPSNMDTPKPEFMFSFTNSRSILSPRGRKDRKHTQEIANDEISENDRKIDFLIFEPPINDQESKVYRPTLSSSGRKVSSGFHSEGIKRCPSPVHHSTEGINDINVQKDICDPESDVITYSKESRGTLNMTPSRNASKFDNNAKSPIIYKESYSNKYEVPSIVAASSICFSHTKNQEMKEVSPEFPPTYARCSSAFVRENLGVHKKNSPIPNVGSQEDELLPLQCITISRDNIILKQTDSAALKDGILFTSDVDVGQGKSSTKGKNEVFLLNDKNKEKHFTSLKPSKENITQNTVIRNGFPFQHMKDVESTLTCTMNGSLSKETDLNKVSNESPVNILDDSNYKNGWIRCDDTTTQKSRSSLVLGHRRQEHQKTVSFARNKECSEENLQQFNAPRKKLHSTSTHSLFEDKYPHQGKDFEKKFPGHRVEDVEEIANTNKTVKLGWSQAFDKYRSFQKSAQSVSERDKYLFTKSTSEISFQKNSDFSFPDPFEYPVIPNPLDILDYTDVAKLEIDNKVHGDVSKTSIHILPNKGKNENTKLLGGNKQKRLTSATKTTLQIIKDDDRKTDLRKRRFTLSPHSGSPRQWTTHFDNSPKPKFPFPKPSRREDKNAKECTWIVGSRYSTTDCNKFGNFGSLKHSNYRINTIKNVPGNSSPRGPRNNTTRIKSPRTNKTFQEKVTSLNDMNEIAMEMKSSDGETHAFLVRVKNAYSEEPKISLEHISSCKSKCRKRPDVSPTAFLTAPRSNTGGMWKEVDAEAGDTSVRNISVTCLPKVSPENTVQSGGKSPLFPPSRCEKKSVGVQEARGEGGAAAATQSPRRGSSPPRNSSAPLPPLPSSAPAPAALPPPPPTPASAPLVTNAATSISRSLLQVSRREHKKESEPAPDPKDRGTPCRRSGLVWGRRWCKQRREGEGGDGERDGAGGGGGEGGGAGGGGGGVAAAPQRIAFCDSATGADVAAGKKTPRVDQRIKEAVASRKRAWRPGSHTRRRGMDAACALRECKYLCSLAAVLDRLAAVYRETDEPAEDMEMDDCPTEDEVTWDSSGCGVQLRQPSTASPMAPDAGKRTVAASGGARAHQGRDRTRGNRPSASRHHSRIPVLARQQQPYLPQYPNDSWCFGLSE